jgi:hypothetical protein
LGPVGRRLVWLRGKVMQSWIKAASRGFAELPPTLKKRH